MTPPRIAIASCTGYDSHKADEELLREALRTRGCEAISVPWDDPCAEWGGFDLCLIKSTWDYNRKYDEFLAWARRVEAVTKLRNPADLIAWNSDKTYLRELGERGVRTVPTVWVSQGSETRLREILAEEGWERAVAKPVVDLGAENLHRVRAGEEGEAALAKILRSHDAMVQPFLPSLETRGETSLIYVGGELTHTVRKRPAPGDFRVQEIWGGTREPTEPGPGEAALAGQALAQLDAPPLYARVDVVEDLDGRPCLIELELIEPNLYLDAHPGAADRLADAVIPQLP
jgi:glutathione synthase/RimK-type ligase-like ATP-grasp enzyme